MDFASDDPNSSFICTCHVSSWIRAHAPGVPSYKLIRKTRSQGDLTGAASPALTRAMFPHRNSWKNWLAREEACCTLPVTSQYQPENPCCSRATPFAYLHKPYGRLNKMKTQQRERALRAWAQVTIVLSVVAEYFNLSMSELTSSSRTQVVVQPRRIAMYLAKQISTASLAEIGLEFGGKHHTAVMRSIVRIDEQRQVDEDLNKAITTLLERIALPRT